MIPPFLRDTIAAAAIGAAGALVSNYATVTSLKDQVAQLVRNHDDTVEWMRKLDERLSRMEGALHEHKP